MDNKNLEIKFGGDLHEIDVDLLIESLINYSSVTQEAAAYLSPGLKVNIKIKAPERGSFKILLDLIAENAGDLFTKDNINLAANIVEIVGGLYGLKYWISKYGRPEKIQPIENDAIKISNNNGDIVISNNVFNIYQENPKVRENLRNTFTKLKEVEEINDFSIKDIDTGRDIFKVEKEDFKLLASFDDEIEQRRQIVVREDQELSIFKIVFKENYKWEFFFQGVKIYASVKDTSFFEKIEKGEIAFRSGDKLIADLEISQVFNEAANTFVNEDYYIIKVKEHMPRISPVQHTLDFQEDGNNLN